MLDVGCGSGLLSAALAYLVGPTGRVHAVDHLPELVALSADNLQRGNPDLLSADRVRLHLADGRLGLPAFAPFDAIHVGAAAAGVPPALRQQLRVGGRLLLPVDAGLGDGSQNLVLVERRRAAAGAAGRGSAVGGGGGGAGGGDFAERLVMPVRYIPLCDAAQQRSAT